MKVKYLERTGICTTDFPQYSAAELFGRVAKYGFGVVQFGFATVNDTGFDADGRIEFPDCAKLPHGALSALSGARRRKTASR